VNPVAIPKPVADVVYAVLLLIAILFFVFNKRRKK